MGGGKWQQPIEQSIEFVQRDGKQAFMASLAFVKQAKPNCINFYTDVCHKGDPAFSICDNIRDTQLVNFSQLNQVKSILADNLSIKRISFFTEATMKEKLLKFQEMLFIMFPQTGDLDTTSKMDILDLLESTQIKLNKIN